MEATKDLKEQREKILAGLEEVYKKLIAFKKSENSPLVISENGTIKHISPFEVKEETV